MWQEWWQIYLEIDEKLLSYKHEWTKQIINIPTNPIAVFGFKAFSLNFILQGSWNAFSSVQGGELQQLAGSQGWPLPPAVTLSPETPLPLLSSGLQSRMSS